jgi:glutathione S-transferase
MELYGVPASTPTRSVALLLEKMNIPCELKKCHPGHGDTRAVEFLKMNPQHNIPVLRNGDFVMNESRTILSYLANAYDKSNQLYSTDPQDQSFY